MPEGETHIERDKQGQGQGRAGEMLQQTYKFLACIQIGQVEVDSSLCPVAVVVCPLHTLRIRNAVALQQARVQFVLPPGALEAH